MAAAGALLAITSCAHNEHAARRPTAVATTAAPKPGSAPPPDSRRGQLGIAGVTYESWISRVRDCTPADAVRALPQLPGTDADLAKRTPTVSIVGRLVPSQAECTLMDCGPGACCNACGFEWVVVPQRDCPGRTLRIHLPDVDESLRGGGMDCALDAHKQHADWVVVTGRIGGAGDVVMDADFCRVRSLAMIEAKDQLTDAEHERLTSPATKRHPAPDAPRCPPR